jgi:hypothetical protein
MRKNSIYIRVIIFIIITIAIVFLNFKGRTQLSGNNSTLNIIKWDNIYSGNNIHFYYLNPQNENLLKVKAKYELNNLIDTKADTLDNSIKIMEFLNSKVKAQSTAMDSDKSTIEIMEMAFNGTKISDRDYATIYEECLISLGINARRGVLQSTSGNIKGKSYFNVCEVWSDKYKKWVMIDGVNGCYTNEKEIPLGAVEIINKGIDKVQITLLKNTDKYVKNMSRYYESYSITVDNNRYGELKSNSQVIFLKGEQLPKIETKEGFTKPAIFVNDPQIFNTSPKTEYVNDNKETVPTLILAKTDLKNDAKGEANFIVGAFMNSYMLADYFLSVNGGDYIKVDRFFELKIVEGVSNIKLSLDGKTLMREVVIEK